MKRYWFSGEKIAFFQKGLTHDLLKSWKFLGNLLFLSKGLKYDNDVLARYTTQMRFPEGLNAISRGVITQDFGQKLKFVFKFVFLWKNLDIKLDHVLDKKDSFLD